MRLIKLTLATGVVLGYGVQSLRADDLNTNTNTSGDLAVNASPTVPLPVPDGYDLVTISRATAVAVPGLEPDRRDSNVSTDLSIKPSTDTPPNTKIEWSGYVQTGIVFRKGRAQ